MYSRRGLLRAVGTGVVAVGAGCVTGEDARSGTTRTTAPRTTRTRTRTPTARPTSTTREPATEAETGADTETPTEQDPETDTETPAPNPGWSEAAALPVEQSAAGGAVLDGKLYYFGGFETDVDLAAVARTFTYDPRDGADGSWERVADLPEKLWGPCGVASDSKLYSFGGSPPDSPYLTGDPPTDRISAYSPHRGWTDLTEKTGVRCPYPNWAMTGAYDSEKDLIYCVGGATAVTDRESATDHGTDSSSLGRYDETRVWVFDPEREVVADPDFARLPEGKRWSSVAIVDVGGRTYLHAIGGGRGVVGPTDSNVRVDLATGAVEATTPVPRPAFFATTANPVLGGEIYLTHARLDRHDAPNDGYATTSLRYDPETDRFAELSARPSHVRSRAVDGVIDGELYVAGGHLKRYDRNDLHDCVRYNERFVPSIE